MLNNDHQDRYGAATKRRKISEAGGMEDPSAEKLLSSGLSPGACHGSFNESVTLQNVAEKVFNFGKISSTIHRPRLSALKIYCQKHLNDDLPNLSLASNKYRLADVFSPYLQTPRQMFPPLEQYLVVGVIPMGAGSYTGASSCKGSEGASLQEDTDAAVVVIPMKRKVEAVHFFTLHRDSINDYPKPNLAASSDVFFFAEYSSDLSEFNDTHYQSRQRAIGRHLKSLTSAPRASVQAQNTLHSVKALPSHRGTTASFLLPPMLSPHLPLAGEVEIVGTQHKAVTVSTAPTRVAVTEVIDVDNNVLGETGSSQVTEISNSIDQLKIFRAKLEKDLEKHQVGSTDSDDQNGVDGLPPSFEQVLREWVPEAGRASIRAMMEDGGSEGRLPTGFEQVLEKWVPEGGRHSASAMMEEGKRELKEQSKPRKTAESLSSALRSIDQVIATAESLSKRDKERITALQDARWYLNTYLIPNCETQLTTTECFGPTAHLEQLLEICVPPIGIDRARELMNAGMEDIQKKYEARCKKQTQRELDRLKKVDNLIEHAEEK